MLPAHRLTPMLTLASACYAYQPVLPRGTPPAVVRVRFATPQDLVVVGPRGDTMALRGVRVVRGSVAAAQGDTLALRVETTEPERPEAEGARLLLVPAADDRVEAERFSFGRTAAGVAVTAAGTVAGISLLTRIARAAM